MKIKLPWNWHWMLAGIAGLVAFLVFVPAKRHYVPEELVGVWTSSDPRYADRSLELTRITVAFGTGTQTVDLYFVSDVEKTLQGNNILYTIRCHRLNGAQEQVSFYHALKNGGEIRFKNQQHIPWMKTEATKGVRDMASL
jgi:hypothetical protein